MSPEAPRDTSVPHRLPVYLACTVLALVINCLLGKEMASDMLSYHLYAGFNALHDRFAQDYFPAGPQSYFNPYVYVPFYLLARSDLSSLEIGSVLAAVHSLMLWLTYELAAAVCPFTDARRRLAFGLCAVAFALVNPVLLQQIGSSFADITSGEVLLAGWLLLALAVRAPTGARVVGAGLLCGLATGLKLTNALHALCGFAVLALLPLDPWRRIRGAIGYGLSLAIGFGVVAAPWSVRLARRFGNPFFPLMNGLFRSPEYTTEPSRAFRFIPASIPEALWRPFAMLDPVSMVHEELRAPDPRYALLLILAAALLFGRLWQRRAGSSRPTARGAEPAAARTLAALGLGLAIDWAAWLAGSGNSRYFLPMSSVAAVVLVALLFRLCAGRPKLRNYLIAGVLAIQAIQLWMGTDYRWNPVPWDARWIRISVPAELTSRPALYLTMGAQTNAFVAPYLAPGAGLINFSGLYTLSPDGASGARIRALMARYAPSIRMLIRGERLYPDHELGTPTLTQVDNALEPFGLRVDTGDCARLAVQGLPPPLEFTTGRSTSAVPVRPRDTTYLLSCRAVPDPRDHAAQIPLHRDADRALDHLEDACPALFQPRRPNTEYGSDGGLRRYGGTDLVAWVSHGSVKFRQPTIGGDVVYLGRESDWAQGPLRLRCGRREGRYFADLAQTPAGP